VHSAGPTPPALERRLVMAVASSPAQRFDLLGGADLVVDGRIVAGDFFASTAGVMAVSNAFTLVAQPVERPRVEEIGDLAAFVGPLERRIPVDVSIAIVRVQSPRPGLVVMMGEPPFVSASTASGKIELSVRGDENNRAEELVQIGIPPDPYVTIVPRATDSMDRVITVAAALRSDLVAMNLLSPMMPLHLVLVREAVQPPRRRR
jgi:hypothetical protein